MASRNGLARVGLAALLTLLAVPAFAQQPTTPTRGYLMGLGGAVVTEVKSPLFGGGVGVNVTPRIQITGEFGRMNDLFPDFLSEDITVNETVSATEGVLLVIKSKVPTFYAMGGIRAIVSDRTAVRPYLSVNGGVARLAPEPTFLIDGIDVSTLVMVDTEMRAAFKDETRPLVSLGGGVAVLVAKHVSVDAGYRYTRIFINKDYLQDTASPHQHSGINVNRFYMGVGFVF